MESMDNPFFKPRLLVMSLITTDDLGGINAEQFASPIQSPIMTSHMGPCAKP